MFDVAPTELLVIAIIALVVIGPKDLPRVLHTVGKWVGRARGVARHFREGLDDMVRQAELDEMEKKWRAENERIMREHPPTPAIADHAAPAIADQTDAAHDVNGQPMLPAAASDLPPHPSSDPVGGHEAAAPEPIPGEVLPTPHILHPTPAATDPVPEPMNAPAKPDEARP